MWEDEATSVCHYELLRLDPCVGYRWQSLYTDLDLYADPEPRIHPTITCGTSVRYWSNGRLGKGKLCLVWAVDAVAGTVCISEVGNPKWVQRDVEVSSIDLEPEEHASSHAQLVIPRPARPQAGTSARKAASAGPPKPAGEAEGGTDGADLIRQKLSAVGRRVQVWWDGEERFYIGTVRRLRHSVPCPNMCQ